MIFILIYSERERDEKIKILERERAFSSPLHINMRKNKNQPSNFPNQDSSPFSHPRFCTTWTSILLPTLFLESVIKTRPFIPTRHAIVFIIGALAFVLFLVRKWNTSIGHAMHGGSKRVVVMHAQRVRLKSNRGTRISDRSLQLPLLFPGFFLFLYVSVTALSFLSSFFGASFVIYFLVKKNLILSF